mmetsp:Transcript_72850/g.236680  ORF Transcript_72850/g.236680 Transcript_72850/m.236680 type:complete len:212 (-) Transcript_72850:119-754(-)
MGRIWAPNGTLQSSLQPRAPIQQILAAAVKVTGGEPQHTRPCADVLDALLDDGDERVVSDRMVALVQNDEAHRGRLDVATINHGSFQNGGNADDDIAPQQEVAPPLRLILHLALGQVHDAQAVGDAVSLYKRGLLLHQLHRCCAKHHLPGRIRLKKVVCGEHGDKSFSEARLHVDDGVAQDHLLEGGQLVRTWERLVGGHRPSFPCGSRRA